MTPAQARRAEQARAILANWRTAGRVVEAAEEVPDSHMEAPESAEGEFTRRLEVACALGDMVTPELTAELAARDEGPIDESVPEAQAAAREDGAATPEDPSPITTRWRAVGLAALCDEPAPRAWLLRHPDQNGKECAPGQGDGLLARGIVGLISAAGGEGKTMSLVALAVAVVTGHPWLGHYHVDWTARGGRVLLVLAEENEAEIHRRLFYVAEHYNLLPEKRAQCAARIVALGLSGCRVPLLGHDGADTPHMSALRERLRLDAGDGWSLVVLDPLARLGPPGAEMDNEAATIWVEALESLTQVPGTPTVLCASHTSKYARRLGQADARGVTALPDGVRWHATLFTDSKGPALTQEKSNYSRPVTEPLRLIRASHGCMRVPTAAEQAAEQHRAEAAAADALNAGVDRVVEALRRMGTASSIDDIVSEAGMRGGAGRAAVRTAMDRGLIVRTGTARERRYCVPAGSGRPVPGAPPPNPRGGCE